MLFKRVRMFGRFMFRVAGYELLEFSNSMVLILGAWALLRPDTDLYSNAEAYRVVAQMMPEDILGFTFLFLGLLKLVALLDGSLQFRQIVAFVITTFWALLFVFLLLGNPYGMLYLWVGLFAIISTIVAARLRVDMDNHIPPWTARV